MIPRIQHFITALMIAFMLQIGCVKTIDQSPPIPYRKTDIRSSDRDKPPRGETDETGYWILLDRWTSNGSQDIDWWYRTAPFTAYDKLGIPTKFPVDENGKSYLRKNNLPEHLKERLKAVKRKHNPQHSDSDPPEYYEDVYDTLCGQLSPKDAVKFFETYNLYNPVVLKHMDDYQAFKYIQRITGPFSSTPNESVNLLKEYARRVFEKQPRTDKGLETGLFLGNISEVLEHHPNNAEALFRWGSHLSNKQPEEAIKHLLRADKYVDQPRRHLLLAHIYQKLDDRENALYHLKECYRLDPLNFQGSDLSDLLIDLLTLDLGKESDAGIGAARMAYEFENYLIICTAFPESVRASTGMPAQKEYDKWLNRMITEMCKAITLSPNETFYKDKLQILLEKRDLDVTEGLHLTFLILDDNNRQP